MDINLYLTSAYFARSLKSWFLLSLYMNNIILLTPPSTELFVFSVVGEGQKLQADVPPVIFVQISSF